MPPRISRANTQGGSSKTKSTNKSQKRSLNAYSIASHSAKDKRNKVARHRLGESLEDGPKPKRRRGDDDDSEEESEDEEAPKRRRQNGPDGDNDIEQGSDSEGNEWTLGGLADGDEDSDLDSDEAFGESDEERFEGFTFRGSQKGARKPKPVKKQARGGEDDDIDLSEGDDNEEEDEDDFGDEGVDLATMLDDDEEDETFGKTGDAEDMDEDSESEDGDDESSESDSDEEEDDDPEDGERIARLRDRLESLDEKPTTAAPAQESALSLDDLLDDLDASSKSKFSAALKTKKKSAKATTLTAPLPKRQQDRIDREIASAKAKEQLDRWRDTVIHNRRAEFLSFPLKNPDEVGPVGKDKFIPSAPQTDLEQSIQQIMEESGLAANKQAGHAADEDAEDALMKAEELATNKLPVEEVMRRRAELRRQRELLFREEVKAKRIAKIKSKSYRRVHRKERERLAEKERKLLDPEGLGLPMTEDEQALMDRRRAEERMSTKHKESKWAKSLKATNRTAWDEGARDSVLEQARRNEELKRRIAGKDVSDGEGSDVPSIESEDDDDDEDDDDKHTMRKLNKLRQDNGENEMGLAGMKFMRNADAKRRAQNDEDIERIRKELAIEDGDEDSSDEINDQGLGRAIFGPKPTETVAAPKPKRPELEEGDESGEDEAMAQDYDEESKTNTSTARPVQKKQQTASGPLSRGSKPDRRDPELRAEAEATSGLSWLTDAGAKKSKKDRQRERDGDNETLILTQPDNTKASTKSPKPANDSTAKETKNAGNTDGWTTVAYKTQDAEDGDAASDDGNPMLTAAQQKEAYHKRAFAGDDVHASFAAEKAAAAAEEDEQEVSNHLPGWGSWTGTGLSKSIRKANARAKHNPLFKTKLPGGVRPEDRQDSRKGRENVIISEKKDRKGKQYLAPVLPRGFERKAEYERSLRLPIGPEWVTKETFQSQTKPRVVVKQGVIAPMERPLL